MWIGVGLRAKGVEERERGGEEERGEVGIGGGL